MQYNIMQMPNNWDDDDDNVDDYCDNVEYGDNVSSVNDNGEKQRQ